MDNGYLKLPYHTPVYFFYDNIVGKYIAKLIYIKKINQNMSLKVYYMYIRSRNNDSSIT